MKGKREFPPDVPSSGDVLSHLSESEMNIAFLTVTKHWHELPLLILLLLLVLLTFVCMSVIVNMLLLLASQLLPAFCEAQGSSEEQSILKTCHK